jgi:hypothetical protein
MSNISIRIGIAAVASIVTSLGGQAADLGVPVKAPPYGAPALNWTGGYIGIKWGT